MSSVVQTSRQSVPKLAVKAGGSAAAMPHPVWRALLSALLVMHLVAIFMAPMWFSMRTAYLIFPDRQPATAENEPPPMPWLYELVRPYLDAAYLNHGYGFFSPDPGPSHLVRYTAELHDGTQVQGTFPKEHWPRLRYHRHFMLTEQVLPGRRAPEAYARHLLHEYGAKRVSLERVRHFLPRAEEVKAGTPLDAPQLYQSLGKVTVEEGGGEAKWEDAP